MAVTGVLLLFVLVASVPVVCLRLLNSGYGHDPREPPLAPQSVPVVGHLIGLITRKYEYFVYLSQRTASPIFTFAVPGQKFYVVTSPKLIQAVQRQHRAIPFGPVVAKFVASLCRLSPEGRRILDDNITMRAGDWGFGFDWEGVVHDGMKLGDGLDVMNRAMILEVQTALNGICPRSDGPTSRIMLVDWLRCVLTAATTNSVYGERNPFKGPGVFEAFWDFEQRMIWFATGLASKYTVPKAIAGRDRLAKAFDEYFADPTLEGTTAFTRARYAQYVKHNIPTQDIPCFEVPLSLGFLVNTVPAAFWTLFHLFADPVLLADVRCEIDAVTATRTEKTGAGQIALIRKLDITSLKENCPVLLSAFQEVLRHRSIGTSVREIVEDTVFEGRWLLKKGALLQMPSRVVHTDPAIWGADVLEFRPRRFLKGSNGGQQRGGGGATAAAAAAGAGAGSACFRSFGGGKQLCPGRHFATNEVLAVVAVLVARFDLRPVVDGGWVEPTTKKTNAAAALMEPDWDVEVEVLIRDRGRACEEQWEVSLRNSEMMFAMVAEDVAGGGGGDGDA